MSIRFRMTPEVRKFAHVNLGVSLGASDHDIIDACAKAVAKGTLSETKLSRLCGTEDEMSKKTTPARLIASASKGAAKRYNPERPVAKHAKTGKPVVYNGRQVRQPSELELAKAGAWARFMLLRGGASIRPLDSHERGLLDEMLEKDTFHVGQADQDANFAAVPGSRVKSLLSDSTSGGLYANPYFFDEMFTVYPLLHSELFPNVEVREMPQSNRIETFALGNPSVTWGTAEGTATTLYNTAGLVSQIQASTFPVQVAIETGRDLLSDSPVAVGEALVEVVGQRMLAELDKVIATGDGTTQPQGLTAVSGYAAVNSDNGLSGPPTVADAEALLYAVPLQYRRQPWNASFVMNDTSYRRFRSLAVGPMDERRVFGSMYFGTEGQPQYSLFEYPVRISADMPNSKVIFAALKKYRMWRRQGFEVRWSDVGQTLMLKNTSLLVVRGRFAGKLLDANAMSMTTDFQS